MRISDWSSDVCSSDLSRNQRSFSNSWRMMPPRKAMSLPARIGAWMSESAEVRVKRGSTWMQVEPRSFACSTKRKATGCASAMFETMTIPQLALARLHGGSGGAALPAEGAEGGDQLG